MEEKVYFKNAVELIVAGAEEELVQLYCEMEMKYKLMHKKIDLF